MKQKTVGKFQTNVRVIQMNLDNRVRLKMRADIRNDTIIVPWVTADPIFIFHNWAIKCFLSVNNENCGPDAVCPNEKCQFHCKKGAKTER